MEPATAYNSFFNVKWNYRMPEHFSHALQKDWNQTFVTMINQVSTHIHMKNLYKPANLVRVNTVLFNLVVKDLEYYQETILGKLIGTRYKLEVDDSIPINECRVQLTDFPNEPYFAECGVSKHLFIHSDSPKLAEAKQQLADGEIVDLTIIEPKHLMGTITIQNLQ